MGFFEDYFKGIEIELKKAGINKDPYVYIKEAITTSKYLSIGIGIALGFLSAIFEILLFKKISIFMPILIGLLSGIFGFFGILSYYRIYPSLKASSRVKELEGSLYIVSLFMTSLSSAGVNPEYLFELLSKYDDFSEIKRESENILKLVNGLGVPLNKALDISAQFSPSKKWKELLNGINSILLEGGDLEAFLYSKSREYIDEYKRKIIEYSNNLQVFLEIYITLVILGVIFTIIMTTLMGTISLTNPKSIEFLQLLAVLIILPLGTIMFVLLIKSANPIQE